MGSLEVKGTRQYVEAWRAAWLSFAEIKSIKLVERRAVRRFDGCTDHVLNWQINGRRFSQSENGLVESGISGTLNREVANKVAGFLCKDLDEVAPQYFDQAAEREQRRFDLMVGQAGYTAAELIPLHTLPEDVAKDIDMEPGTIDDIKSEKPTEVLEVKSRATRSGRRGRPKGSRNRAKSAPKTNKRGTTTDGKPNKTSAGDAREAGQGNNPAREVG